MTLSWFPASSIDAALGELQVVHWEGVVSRPGSAHRAAGGAREVWQTLLIPVETADATWRWQSADGSAFDDTALVALCNRLLAGEPAVTPVAEPEVVADAAPSSGKAVKASGKRAAANASATPAKAPAKAAKAPAKARKAS